MRITLKDCREVFYCSKGIRFFFAKYKLDYKAFLEGGIDANELLSINDSMANKVVEYKRGKV